MKVSRAIEIKENHQRLHLDEYYSELLEADNLSIEALKFWKDLQDRGALPINTRLPGETKD